MNPMALPAAIDKAPLAERPFQFTLGLALPVSLLLHGLLVAAAWALMHASPPHPSSRPLDLQLLGMLSERQVAQQAKIRPPSTPPAARAPAPRQEASKKALASTHASPSPVLVADTPQPKAPSQAEPTPPSPPVPPAEPALEDRQQQTIQPRESEADILRRYLVGVGKAIQRHLVYPPEAPKSAGQVGAPVVRFTLTEQGEILPGSLGIRQSSGYPLLDEQALRAAQASAPFDKPPRRIEVAMTIAFVQEK